MIALNSLQGLHAVLEADFALFNVDQLVTMAPGCHAAAEGELGIIRRGALAADGPKIVWVGLMDEMHERVRLKSDASVLNTHGRSVLPGFVDPHTHPVFAGDRTGDFYARAGGQRYEEQIEGGIMQTVRATRSADVDELLALAYRRAETFLQYGTTTIGARTGYGLTTSDELKSLDVLNHLQRIQCLKIVPALLAAHVVPEEYLGRPDAYVEEIIQDLLPRARDRAHLVDVWCDEGAFTETQCRAIMEAARNLGYELTAHASELGPSRGVRLAADLGALSVDHAVYLDDQDIRALADSGTVAVLLPGTTFFLRSDVYAPARRLLDAGVAVALGTDFNPGTSFTQNMQFILTLAVLKLGMTAEEAVAAATMSSARAVGMADRVGSLEPGKYCDFTVFRVDDYRAIPYSYAMNLAETVVAAGQIVVREGAVITEERSAVAVS
jgi:imidazolonepropionase